VRTPEHDAFCVRAEARRREQECCPDCPKRRLAFQAALDKLKRSGLFDLTCPAHPTLIWHDAENTTTPEDTLREAGISTKRQAKYQRRMSSLLAGGG